MEVFIMFVVLIAIMTVVGFLSLIAMVIFFAWVFNHRKEIWEKKN